MKDTAKRDGGDARRRAAWGFGLAGPVILLPIYLLMGGTTGAFPLAFGGVLALTLVSFAAVTDARWGKIFNGSTYSACLWGLALSFLGRAEPGLARSLGVVEPWEAGLGLVVCFAAMLVLQDLTGGGTGDVKLGAALGVLLGTEPALKSLLLGIALAGLWAIAGCLVRGGLFVTVGAFAKSYAGLLCPAAARPVLTDPERALIGRRVRLGPHLAAGTILTLAGFWSVLP